MAPSELVIRLLRSVGRPAEAEQYLAWFRAEAPERFAVIAVDAGVVGGLEEALAADLACLAELGLTPVVVCESEAQVDSLAACLDPAHVELVVGAAAAARAARAGHIPLCAAAAAELPALVETLASRKVVLLGPRTGLAANGGEILPLVVTSEVDELGAGLAAADRAVLRLAGDLAERSRHPVTVAVTSPLELLRELFTVRGAGTMVRRGATITSHRDLAAIDRARLVELIEGAFGRPLRPGFLDRPVERLFVADELRGAALFVPSPLGPYLSKFAVEARARGEGVGRDLWRVLTREVPRFFWRSRPDNPITAWYEQQCEGLMRLGAWQVFWRGLDDGQIAQAVAYARTAPPDFDD